jgi:uncharacterized iron-regulated membrane protein
VKDHGFLRTFHRFAGAVLALQLILWVLTGFLFNYKYRYDEALEQLRAAPAAPSPGPWTSPGDAAGRAGIEPAALRRVELLNDTRGFVYLLEAGAERTPELRLADARTGEPVAPLDALGAEAVLRSALAGSANSARYGKVNDAKQIEALSLLLGRATPAWELQLDSGQTVTVNAFTAEISHTSTLNDAIDWTYRVHYMRYTPWQSFNIGLVIAFIVMVLALVASGLRMLVSARPRAMFGRRTGRLPGTRNQRLRF